jgi:MOSC domain-containing protein YiiM
MELLRVNIGQPRELMIGSSLKKTGINKEEIAQPVQLTELGLVGDFIASKKHHGGPDQAVYIYTEPDYRWWVEELQGPLAYGTFGENLVISELESAPVAAGDRLVIGSGDSAVILEATSPRIPCNTLAAVMNDPHFPKRFRVAARPGIYCRVIRAGSLQAGLPVSYQPCGGERVTMLEQFVDFYEPETSRAGIQRLLNAPIAIRTRNHLEDRLQKI